MALPCTLQYPALDVVDYINWSYFFHAWSVKGGTPEADTLQREALELLQQQASAWKEKGKELQVLVRFGRFECNSDGDDVILYPQKKRLHFRRQHFPSADGYCWCLSDFIRPKDTGIKDEIGVFAAEMDRDFERVYSAEKDPYLHLLVQTLADRLAEAGLEKGHEEIRKRIWGYAPDENLTIPELHAEKFQGIRPAVGYPSMPDQEIIFDLDNLIDFSSIGITLTETGAMIPHAAVSGLMIAHPHAKYFSI